jgi:FtsZ-binding cell division protein ZapB|uniref:Uncharacterized protein n=1 Tax=viral metagenome TaxID=1070528 RepID=A0A6C0JR09_9ZZZZ
MDSLTTSQSIDNTINLLKEQIETLKEKLQEEREEHRSIYSKLKKENEFLMEENQKLKNK